MNGEKALRADFRSENARAAKKKRILRILQAAGAVCVTLVMVFPMYWLFITALKGDREMMAVTPSLWPETFHWENFAEVFRRIPLIRYMFNTLLVTFFQMVLQVGTGILAAYGFARGRFKGRDLLFVLVLGALMIPNQVTFIPLYVVISRLGWVDTYAGLVMPGAVSAYFIFMMRQNFRAVDQSYLDAGRVDGLGVIGTIIHILIPMCRASIMTASLVSFINGWNNYFWPKILSKSDATRLITVGMVKLSISWGDAYITEHFNVTLAGVFITMIPVIIMFFANQKYMLSGYSKASMK